MTVPALTPGERAKVDAFGIHNDHHGFTPAEQTPLELEECEPHFSPDCRDGKHLACTRHKTAWCVVEHDYSQCECDCHEMEPHA